MASPGTHLAAVLRAGQARLDVTGVHKKHKEDLATNSNMRWELAVLTARQNYAQGMSTQLREELEHIVNATKRDAGPNQLALWEREGFQFLDPQAVADEVYHLLVDGKDEEAIARGSRAKELAAMGPAKVLEGTAVVEQAREEARPSRRRRTTLGDVAPRAPGKRQVQPPSQLVVGGKASEKPRESRLAGGGW